MAAPSNQLKPKRWMDGDWSVGDLDGMCVVDAVWLKLVQHRRRFGCRNTVGLMVAYVGAMLA